MTATTLPANSQPREPNHILRASLIWAFLASWITPIMYFVLGPHLAPGIQTSAAASEQWDMTVLLTVAAPAMLSVYVWFGYSIAVFRNKGHQVQDGAWLKTEGIPVQVGWVLLTTAVVVGLFIFGTYELIIPNGAGGGEGPSAIWAPTRAGLGGAGPPLKHSKSWAPAANPAELQVQVLGQQWDWTYRWPQFGGVETSFLELPNNTWVQFNVTSLDVIHDFWAYRLGVKADANPGVNNIAFAKTLQTGPFTVRCDELCGIWHGAMVGKGKVVSQSTFYKWIKHEKVTQASDTKVLPPYSLTYTPSLHGAGGGYYQGLTSPQPKHLGS